MRIKSWVKLVLLLEFLSLLLACTSDPTSMPISSCEDGKKNGNETDIDCGGGVCEACPDEKSCNIDSDCVDNVCNNKICVGSHECGEGYQREGSENCVDIDECTLGTARCDENATCHNTDGSYDCVCNSPFVGDGFNCVDAADCTADSSICDTNAICTDQGYSRYLCICKNGYDGDGVACTDINECDLEIDNCHENANCVNNEGSFSCECLSGYEDTNGDGTQCQNIDECSRKSARGTHTTVVHTQRA